MSTPESGKSETVSIRVLDREYTVGVTEAERASLTSAARMLDARMRELRGSNKMVAPDRLAVLTALNLAYQLADSTPRKASAAAQEPGTAADAAQLDALINERTVVGHRYNAQSASEVDTETFEDRAA